MSKCNELLLFTTEKQCFMWLEHWLWKEKYWAPKMKLRIGLYLKTWRNTSSLLDNDNWQNMLMIWVSQTFIITTLTLNQYYLLLCPNTDWDGIKIMANFTPGHLNIKLQFTLSRKAASLSKERPSLVRFTEQTNSSRGNPSAHITLQQTISSLTCCSLSKQVLLSLLLSPHSISWVND